VRAEQRHLVAVVAGQCPQPGLGAEAEVAALGPAFVAAYPASQNWRDELGVERLR